MPSTALRPLLYALLEEADLEAVSYVCWPPSSFTLSIPKGDSKGHTISSTQAQVDRGIGQL